MQFDSNGAADAGSGAKGDDGMGENGGRGIRGVIAGACIAAACGGAAAQDAFDQLLGDEAAVPQAYADSIPVAPMLPEPAQPAPAPRTMQIEEIVITAQKREQRLVDVPIAVSSLSGEAVKNARIEQVRDIAGYIPNVDIKEQVPGAIPVVAIRGVGLDDFSSTNSPAAGIYVDQVPLSSLALMSFDLVDLERLEVLKGPQGTLYGRNSTAGAINVLSARPLFEREGYLGGGYGSYRTWDVEGMFNTPLSDTLALRVAAKLLRQDEGFWKSRLNADDPSGIVAPAGGLLPILGGTLGLPLPPIALARDTSNDPIKRDIGRRDIRLGRVRLGWEATDSLHIDLKLEALRQRSELGQPEHFGHYCRNGAQPIDPDNCTDALGYADRDRDPYRGDWRGEFPYDIDQWSATLLADWDLDWATLSSVSGYIDFERFFHIDVDAMPADQFEFFQADAVQQFTQELRLAASGDAVDWLVGLFWSSDDIVVGTDGVHTAVIPAERSRIDADQTTRAAAAFAHLDWRFTDTLALTAGLRWTSESRDYVGGTSWTVNLPGQINDTFIDARIEDRNWSWKLGLSHTPSDDALLYASVSRGNKSGGFFSGVTTDDTQLQPYRPESLTAWEIGYKRQGLLTFSASAFWYDYRDVQTFIRANDAPVQLIGNVPEATNYGLDLEVLRHFVDGALAGLTLQSGVGLLRSELGSFEGPTGEPVASGNRLANAPELTFNGLARYEFPLLATNRLGALQVDAHYSDDTFKEATNDPLIASDAYWIFNARAALMPAARNWEIAVWGRNLGDERYVVQGLNVGAFYFGNRNYNAPRTYGVEFSWRFAAY
jgi:iron complex outermembrane recepter protein